MYVVCPCLSIQTTAISTIFCLYVFLPVCLRLCLSLSAACLLVSLSSSLIGSACLFLSVFVFLPVCLSAHFCLLKCLSVFSPVWLSFVYCLFGFVYLSVYMFACPLLTLFVCLIADILPFCHDFCLSVCLSVCLPFWWFAVTLSVCHPTFSLSVVNSVCLSVHLYVFFFTSLLVWWSRAVTLYVCPPFCVPRSLPVCPSVCLCMIVSVCVSTYLSDCLLVCCNSVCLLL